MNNLSEEMNKATTTNERARVVNKIGKSLAAG